MLPPGWLAAGHSPGVSHRSGHQLGLEQPDIGVHQLAAAVGRMRRSYRPLSPLSYPATRTRSCRALGNTALRVPSAAGVDRAAGGSCACSGHDFVERSDVYVLADADRPPAGAPARSHRAIGDVGDVGQLAGGDQLAVAPRISASRSLLLTCSSISIAVRRPSAWISPRSGACRVPSSRCARHPEPARSSPGPSHCSPRSQARPRPRTPRARAAPSSAPRERPRDDDLIAAPARLARAGARERDHRAAPIPHRDPQDQTVARKPRDMRVHRRLVDAHGQPRRLHTRHAQSARPTPTTESCPAQAASRAAPSSPAPLRRAALL